MLTKKTTQSTRKAVTGSWRTKKTLLHMFSTLDHRPSLSMGPSPQKRSTSTAEAMKLHETPEKKEVLTQGVLNQACWHVLSTPWGFSFNKLRTAGSPPAIQSIKGVTINAINTSRHLMGFPLSQAFFHASSRTWDQVPLTVTTRSAVVRRFRDFRGSSFRFIRPRTLDGHHETH